MPSPFKNLNQFRGLSKEIYILSFANIINRIGCFVSVFFTLYLTQTLGFSAKTAGTIIMIYGLAGILGTGIGGKLGDHLGRKKMLVWSKFVSAWLIVFCGFFLKSPYTVLLLIIAGLLRGADRPINNALIMDLTDSNNRKTAFSLLYLCDNLGFAIGAALAGFLFKNYIQWVFFGDALTSLGAISLIFLYIPETLPKQPARTASASGADGFPPKESTFKMILKRPELLIFIMVILLDKLIYTQYSFSLPLYIKEIFAESGETYYGWLMSFNSVIVLLITNFIFLFTKKHSPLTNIAIGSLLYGIGFGMLYFLRGNSWITLAFVSTFIWTLGEIMNATNLNLFIADNSPVEYRGRFSGFYHMFSSAGKTISPFISGIILTLYGLANIWPIVFLLAVLLCGCTLLILFLKSRSRKTEPSCQMEGG